MTIDNDMTICFETKSSVDISEKYLEKLNAAATIYKDWIFTETNKELGHILILSTFSEILMILRKCKIQYKCIQCKQSLN